MIWHFQVTLTENTSSRCYQGLPREAVGVPPGSSGHPVLGGPAGAGLGAGGLQSPLPASAIIYIFIFL